MKIQPESCPHRFSKSFLIIYHTDADAATHILLYHTISFVYVAGISCLVHIFMLPHIRAAAEDEKSKTAEQPTAVFPG